MANSKISALTSASTVVGTEVLPIVQSSATVKVAISDLNPGLSTISATKGGTGQTSYAVGDLLYADTTTTLAKLADVATGNALISGGVGVAPSYGKIGLTTHVSGTLPIANGGTATTTAFTTGSVVFAGASGVYSQNNSSFFWDNTNIELGIGTSSPSATIHASAPLSAGTIVNVGMFGQNSGSNPTVGQGAKITLSATNNAGRCAAIQGVHESATNAHYLAFLTSANGTDPAERMRISSTGGVSIASTTNAGAGNLLMGTGNITQGTAAKGVNFTANTPAAGMTSQLLNWYEEGTWTPADGSGAGLVFTITHARYTRVGRLVTANTYLTYPITASAANARITLPFTAALFDVGVANSNSASNATAVISVSGSASCTVRNVLLANLTNANMSASQILFSISYTV